MAFVLILISSLFFGGIINRTKSIVSGRKGPVLLQPIKDIVRLLKKGTIYSKTSSVIFQIAPTIYFSSVLFSTLFIPFSGQYGLISFPGDFVLFAYLLALGKFFMIISALDTGSSFEGMGASREALYAMLIEPAFFLIFGSFALLTGHNSFHDIFSSLHFGSYISYMLRVLSTFVLVMIAMIENSRMPIDDPKTHLELTMIHEVMILDNSGFDLGLILYTTQLKFALYGGIIANFYISGLPFYYSIPLFFAVQFFFAIVAGLLESFTARFRMSHNAQYIFALSSISVMILFGVLLILYKAL